MSETKSLTSAVAVRYATALFTLCKEVGKLKALEKDISAMTELLLISSDFRLFIGSPMYRREQLELGVQAISKHLKVLSQTESLLRLLARKGRMFILPAFVEESVRLINKERDEIGIEVVSAGSLSKSQINQLEESIGNLLKKKAKVQIQVDKSLIGGLIVKLGSKMIDTTTKSKLLKLQTIMKEVN